MVSIISRPTAWGNIICREFCSWLKKQDSKEVNCSFEQIEKIGNGKLPDSAYKYAAWWSNSTTHTLMRYVLKMGWESKNLDLQNKTITFYEKISPSLLLAMEQAGLVQTEPKKSLLGSLSSRLRKARRKEDVERKNARRKADAKRKEEEKATKRQINNQLKEQTPDFTVDGKGIYFEHILEDFVSQIAKGKTEIYNEASIQYELAIFLREVIPNYKIQLERNVSYFELNKKHFLKREIDIVLFNTTKTRKFAIEIKYPLSEVPIQMYKFCEDIKFLEQLKESGFTDNFFLAITPQSQFWNGRSKKDTIYEKFRKEKELYGTIKNQIGDSKEEVTLKGRHKINWLTINDSTRYFVMRV